MVSTSGGPYLSIAAAFIVGVDALFAAAFFVAAGAFLALRELGFRFLAVVALVFLAALRLPLEGLLTPFFEDLLALFFEPLLRAFFFLVAILTCSLFVRLA
jgi:hypothetical protein